MPIISLNSDTNTPKRLVINDYLEGITLPEARVNRRGDALHCVWGNDTYSRDMRFLIATTLSLLDANAPWLHNRYPEDRYYNILSERVCAICDNDPNFGRSIVISGSVCRSIVKWIEDAYDVGIYQSMGSEPTVRFENTPRCPQCESYLILKWISWRDSMALMWYCPHSTDRCRDTISRLWSNMYPSVVNHGIYFHNWEVEGHPIPVEYMSEPLSQWTLTHSDHGLQSRRVEGGVLMRGRGNRVLNEEQEKLLRDSYEEFGPAVVLLKYPEAGFTWNQLLGAAARLGLRQRNGNPGKKIKKHMRNI